MPGMVQISHKIGVVQFNIKPEGLFAVHDIDDIVIGEVYCISVQYYLLRESFFLNTVPGQIFVSLILRDIREFWPGEPPPFYSVQSRRSSADVVEKQIWDNGIFAGRVGDEPSSAEFQISYVSIKINELGGAHSYPRKFDANKSFGGQFTILQGPLHIAGLSNAELLKPSGSAVQTGSFPSKYDRKNNQQEISELYVREFRSNQIIRASIAISSIGLVCLGLWLQPGSFGNVLIMAGLFLALFGLGSA